MGKRYIVFKGETITLTKHEDGLWRSDFGTIYAFREETSGLNRKDLCGVFPFVIPIENPMSDGCRVHDGLYSNPAYQAFHTRKEADEHMLRMHKLSTKGSVWGFLSKPFYYLVRVFGGLVWKGKN